MSNDQGERIPLPQSEPFFKDETSSLPEHMDKEIDKTSGISFQNNINPEKEANEYYSVSKIINNIFPEMQKNIANLEEQANYDFIIVNPGSLNINPIDGGPLNAGGCFVYEGFSSELPGPKCEPEFPICPTLSEMDVPNPGGGRRRRLI